MSVELIDTGASLSPDGRYRFSLWRRWSPGGRFLTFVMLNPSTADADRDDPTVRRCIGFAQHHGYTGLVVVNLYALISTDPKGLWKAEDPVGPGNDELLQAVLTASAGCSVPVVAAWGANARDDRVRWLLGQPGAECLHSLGVTGFGAPKHPLARGKSRIPDHAEIVPWPAPQREVLVAAKSGSPRVFKAQCNLTEHRWERRLNDEERAEAKAKGYERVFVQLDSERVDKETGRHGRWEVCFPACGGFETTDPQAYLRHMAEAHNRPLDWSKGYSEAFSRSVRAGWRSPALKAEGKPLSKDAAAQLRVCPTCDLHGEVSDNAGELWWAEHERGCKLAVAS